MSLNKVSRKGYILIYCIKYISIYIIYIIIYMCTYCAVYMIRVQGELFNNSP
mgnify:CR=1 FL=1